MTTTLGSSNSISMTDIDFWNKEIFDKWGDLINVSSSAIIAPLSILPPPCSKDILDKIKEQTEGWSQGMLDRHKDLLRDKKYFEVGCKMIESPKTTQNAVGVIRH